MKKINLKDFKFQINYFSIDAEIWKEYFGLTSRAKLAGPPVATQKGKKGSKPIIDDTAFPEADKEQLKTFRQEFKKLYYSLTGVHKKTRIAKTWEIETLKFDRKALCLEIQAEVSKKRSELKVVKEDFKEFAGAKYKTVGGVFDPNLKGIINVIAQDTSFNNPMVRKTPNTKNKNYIGIELEFNEHTENGHYSTKDIGAKLKKAGLARYVDVTTDGTCGYEVRVLLPELEFEEPLKKILKVLKDMGFSTDDRCGTHVHIDMRRRDVNKVYRNYFFTQSFMRKFLTKARKLNKYCYKNEEGTFEAQQIHDRYRGINVKSYEKHSTLEIRMHQGTLNADELVPWVKLLLKIANFEGELNKRILTLKSAQTFYNLEESLSLTLKKRLINLSGKSVGA